MIIRPASRKDCQAIYSLYQSEKWLSFTEEKVTSLFSTNLSHYLVLEEDQKILGFACYLTDKVLTTFLAEIIIDKSHRRKGLGQQLIEEIHKKYPLTRIELISEADGFYRAIGFKPVGTGLENLNERRQPMTLDNKLGLTDSLELAKMVMRRRLPKPV